MWQFGTVVFTPNNAALPTARMPVALRASPPDIASAAAGGLVVQASAGSVVTRPLPISNVGNPTLTYDFVEGAQPTTLFSQGPITNSGYLSTRYAAATPPNTGDYAADDFVAFSDAAVTSLRADGFVLPNTPITVTNTPTISFYVYADDNGQPAGGPEGVGDAPVWTFTAAPNAAGVTIVNNAISLNLATAGAPALNLDAGRYWLIVAPNMVGNGSRDSTANPAWVWYHLGIAAPPASFSGAFPQVITPVDDPTWFPVTASGLAGVINGSIQCGVDFATLSSETGDLGANETDTLTVTFDTTDLAAGTYTGYLCASTSGTDPDEALLVVPVTLTVLAEGLFNDSFEDAPTP